MRTSETIQYPYSENLEYGFIGRGARHHRSIIRPDCREETDAEPIKTDESGAIDYAFYKSKARSIRSEALCSFFKAIISNKRTLILKGYFTEMP